LLGDEDFVESSTWADRVRNDRPETYNWHFVNIPYAAASYDPARDCPPTERGDCSIAAIQRARLEIVSTTRSHAQRAESLKFLIHFVEDLHQPLHNIGNADRGGNDVGTVVEGLEPAPGRGQPNLHSVWDSVLITRRGIDEETYAKQLIDRVKTGQADDGGDLDVVRWSIEARDLAVKHVYTYQGFAPGLPPTAAARIDGIYERAAQPIIDTQLMRAGVRLARLLNEAAIAPR
jgi:hypothetical protein